MITSRLDWYTVVLENTSFEKIFKKIEFPIVDYETLSLRTFSDTKGGSNWVFSLDCGLNFRVPFDELFHVQSECFDRSTGEFIKPFDMYSVVFSRVRVDFPGATLDYLRRYGFDVDYEFQLRSFWNDICSSWHLTRVDFAFDFFNESKTFLTDLFRCISDLQYQSEKTGYFGGYKLKNMVSSKPLKCSVKRSSDQRTLYLGSTTGNKLLRIYDKFLESHKNGAWITEKIPWWCDISPDEITDWCRFELQTRRELCQTILFDDVIPDGYKSAESMNFRDVLRHIFQYYLAYTENDELNGLIRSFFDVSKCDRIEYHKPVQNVNLVQFRELNEKFIDKSILRLVRLSMDYNIGEVAGAVNNRLVNFLRMAVVDDCYYAYSWIARFDMLISKLCLEYGREHVLSRLDLCQPIENHSDSIYLLKI